MIGELKGNKKNMKNKNKKYKPYGKIKENRSNKLNKKIITSVVIYSAIIAVGMMINGYIHLVKEVGAVETTSILVPTEIDSSLEALSPLMQVDKILDEYKVSKEFRENFHCLIKNESGYNPNASSANVHRNGLISVDRGVAQINSQVAPFYVTYECAYNLECSVKASVEYLLETNNWDRWFGWLHNCK